jgi:hypothetical protein
MSDTFFTSVFVKYTVTAKPPVVYPERGERDVILGVLPMRLNAKIAELEGNAFGYTVTSKGWFNADATVSLGERSLIIVTLTVEYNDNTVHLASRKATSANCTTISDLELTAKKDLRETVTVLRRVDIPDFGITADTVGGSVGVASNLKSNVALKGLG